MRRHNPRMPTITLAKALKVKNRQIQKVKDLQGRITTSNSTIVGSPPDFDARALYEELKTETERLWKLKAAINAANVPVHATIYDLAEAKGLIAFLKGLDTKRGMSVVSYMAAAPQQYEAQITAADSKAEIEALETRIDELQDVLDAHNATATLTTDF